MTPTLILALAWAGLVLAAIPALLTINNLRLFQPPPPTPPAGDHPLPKVSVLVPARNEEGAIGRLVTDVLASEGIDVELVVLDDASEDATASIVASLAESDPRVRLVRGLPPPAGWCGKQHACWQLSQAAQHDTWVFLDVDVKPARDGIARSVGLLEASNGGLMSGFPRQETGSFLEWLLLPLIHFVLLGYLPLARARQVNTPSLGAGCGQLFVTRRKDYEQAGGHAAIRRSLHDGVKLPRAYRRAGLMSDIFDATEIASCRMYSRSIDVWRGLSKNATEGVGSAATIFPFTLLLGGGAVLPVVLAAWGLVTRFAGWPSGGPAVALTAAVLAYLPRILEAVRFRQSLWSVPLHPLGVAVFLVIQWTAWVRKSLGFETAWRGRRLAAQ
jgi:glycosyltransferase involved in cell wall biosynthesis